MKLDLYRIDKEYELLFNLIEEHGFNEEMEVRLNDTLHEFDTTALNIGANIKNLKAKITLMKQYENDMAEKRESLEKKISGFEGFLKKNMPLFERNKIEGPELSIRVSSTKPIVQILTNDLSKIEDCHKRIKVVESIDKDAIRDDLEHGEDLPYAKLVPSYSLTIR